MKNRNDYYVYTHEYNGEVFWVGKGSDNIHSTKSGRRIKYSRANKFSPSCRNEAWIAKVKSMGYKPTVKYAYTGLTHKEALRLENELTLFYGIENLCNDQAGVSKTQETKDKISATKIGIPRSQSTREKISASKMGVSKPVVVCPHCGKEGGGGIMHRWHYDNCKHKIDN
jgi:hypothetical protein